MSSIMLVCLKKKEARAVEKHTLCLKKREKHTLCFKRKREAHAVFKKERSTRCV